MFITTKRILLFSGFLILIVGIAFYFYQQKQPNPEPITIYNVPHLDFQAKSPPAGAVQDKVTPIVPLQRDKEQSLPQTPPAAVMDISSTTEKKDDALSEEVIQKWVTDVKAEIERLNTRFLKKYPELFNISNMTKEDFLKRYPTPEAQQELLEYVQRVQPEMFAELRAVFSNLPIEIVDDILLEAKNHFVQMWGQETTDQVILQLRTELGL